MEKMLQDKGIYKKIEESVMNERYSIEEVSNYCRNLNLDLKAMYFQGFTWNEIDLFKGDVTELIPYYTPYIKEKVDTSNN